MQTNNARVDSKSVSKLYSEYSSEVHGLNGRLYEARFHRGLGLVLLNIFISDLIDGIDYAYYICRQHQIVSMLEDKIGIQNGCDKSD